MPLKAFILGCFFLSTGIAAAADCSKSPIRKSQQVVLSISPHWNSKTTRIQRFTKNFVGVWGKTDRKPFAAVVGRSGMGWGLGAHPAQSGTPVKQEGDGRAPAGAFDLAEAFGYGDASKLKFASRKNHLKYTQVDADSRCVDDTKSKFYNTNVFDQKKVGKEWASDEALRRPDDQYEYVIGVNHNGFNHSITFPMPDGSVRGAGSCIFLHKWKGPDENGVVPGTAGCTAMPKERIKKILEWARPDSRPMLVQLPLREYLRLKKEWCLPEIDMKQWLESIAAATIEDLAELHKLVQDHCLPESLFKKRK